ncbi:MAG: helix-turn-helix domain-containing protein [Proteobacteria bacterium]|nr:helix-turn-helix domain-containing protein [Pseudomonadota bacterium]
MTDETLGERLKAAREQRRLDQVELAFRSGVSQATISALEKRRSVRSKYTGQLAKALGVSYEWLASGVSESSTRPHLVEPSPEVDNLNFEWLMQKATPRTQTELRRIINAAVEGRLTESDVVAIAAIVDRITEREPSKS